jgi:hypothetical protein
MGLPHRKRTAFDNITYLWLKTGKKGIKGIAKV